MTSSAVAIILLPQPGRRTNFFQKEDFGETGTNLLNLISPQTNLHRT